jgi:DNA helicase-2/ATP-dependent DNA helicase PcrA
LVPEGMDITENEDDRSLSNYMKDIALLTDADNNKKDTNVVSLMTIHASKGLEFPYVYVVGMEENLFPSQLSINSRTELEEERRLFYVAVTRAEIKATLSWANTRYRWGNLTYCEPSRFIEEIDTQFIEQPSSSKDESKSDFSFAGGLNNPSNTFSSPSPSKPTTTRRVNKPTFKPSKLVTDANFKASDSSLIEAGQNILHQRFGKGNVAELSGIGENKKALINFENAGQKQLLLRFAKLQILPE